MYQILASPIVGAPQSGYILKLLHNDKTLYVPSNGQKSTHEVSDTREDMMEIFHTDASGGARDLKKLMGRRNYVVVVPYDQERAAQGPLSPTASNSSQQPPSWQQKKHQKQGLTRIGLAVDFVVQGDGAITATTTRYGPVIVPHLEYGM